MLDKVASKNKKPNKVDKVEGRWEHSAAWSRNLHVVGQSWRREEHLSEDDQVADIDQCQLDIFHHK